MDPNEKIKLLEEKIEILENSFEKLKLTMDKNLKIFSKFIHDQIDIQKKVYLSGRNYLEDCSTELSVLVKEKPTNNYFQGINPVEINIDSSSTKRKNKRRSGNKKEEPLKKPKLETVSSSENSEADEESEFEILTPNDNIVPSSNSDTNDNGGDTDFEDDAKSVQTRKSSIKNETAGSSSSLNNNSKSIGNAKERAEMNGIIKDNKTMKKNIQTINEKLNSLLNNFGQEGGNSPMPTTTLLFPSHQKIVKEPFTKMEEFKEFDQKLSEEDAEKLVIQLMSMPLNGQSITKAIRTSMEIIMTLQLADNFSLKGLKGNENFSNTLIYKVILEALQRKGLFGDISIVDYDKALSSFFKHVPEYIKKRPC